MSTLFISDLHLSNQRTEITQTFLYFLDNHAPTAEAIYILGDLFELWIGDDVSIPEYQIILDGLARLTAQRVPVYVMHGNRDFLLGKEFEQKTGCKILDDPTIIDLYGTSTMLMHGDTLCTDDVDYQDFRRMVRNPDWQQGFLARTPQERLMMAQQYRTESKKQVKDKAPEIMDVNQQAVEKAMTESHVLHLIHGHTHRPAIHDFMLNGQHAQRIVLGDWYEQGSMLRCDGSGCELLRFNAAAD